jgi:metallo-beta-lactamase class B
LFAAGIALAAAAGPALAQSPFRCSLCAQWNLDQEPFRVYGDTYYVGMHGLASILVTSPAGHVLIDGDLAPSAPKIAEHIRALGFRVEDVKLILNSHVHFDHAGGLAELQRLSGARIAASDWSAKALRYGHAARDDPQYGSLPPTEPIARVEVVQDGETVHLGPLELTAHLTPGHTPGGTTWTWRSCEKGRCLDIVYADSLNPIASKGFLFSDTLAHPGTLAQFAKSYAVLASLRCDVLVTPHPEVSDLWGRLARRERGEPDALVDPEACRRLADGVRAQLDARVDAERSGRIR